MGDNIIFSKDSKYFNGEPDYMPYCLNCNTMRRMDRTDNGAECKGCGITFTISDVSLNKFKLINGRPWKALPKELNNPKYAVGEICLSDKGGDVVGVSKGVDAGLLSGGLMDALGSDHNIKVYIDGEAIPMAGSVSLNDVAMLNNKSIKSKEA